MAHVLHHGNQGDKDAQSRCERYCRGNGFAIDPGFLKADPHSSSARVFFESILDKPYLRQIVLAPHLYCPAVGLPADFPC